MLTVPSVLLQAEAAQLYIISLGVLAPYRSQGVGTSALGHSTSICAVAPLKDRSVASSLA